jgi:tetratricopeptide (TPR) repeat protein
MGQKSRQKRSAWNDPRPAKERAAPRGSRHSSSRPELKHRWVSRLVASVVVPLVLLGLIEIALRVCSYGYSPRFFEITGDGKTLTTNQKFAWQFYSRAKATSPVPQLFSKEKAPGTFRIFVLGESAAAGTPDPAFGFARQLELMLADQYPAQRFEVINAAMRGIDSHIVRQIAGECARLSPDLFIIYMGNNELIGLHAPSPEEFQLSANVHWIRLQHSIKRSKLAQLGNSLLARMSQNGKAEEQDMEFFRRQRLAFDDPKREPVYRNYANNLRDICGFAEAAGAQALVCTVGVNLRDFPPLGSLHRRDWNSEQQKQWEQFYAAGIDAETRRDFPAALTRYENAARLDDHFAELLYRMARCYEVTGQLEKARQHYVLARDWDAIQFRTDSRLNNAARTVATNASPRPRFVDVEKSIANNPLVVNGIPGEPIFHEHVHLKFDCDHYLATTLLPEIAAALKLPPPSKALLTRDECARRLAYTSIDEGNMKVAVARLTAHPPFLDQIDHASRQAAADAEVQRRLGQVSREEVDRTLNTYREAIQARPDDWMLRFNFGNLLTQMNRPREAAAEFAEVVKRLPGNRTFRMSYGTALLQSGLRANAAEQFTAALKMDPDYKPAQQALAAAQGRAR